MAHRRLFNSCFPRRACQPRVHVEKVITTTTIEDHRHQRVPGPVVVELFTSQGCASSHEAEVLFSILGRGDFNVDTPLLLLAFHVDYWDYNRWKDPFASARWTVRQKAYVEALNLDTMFTPQIVVQGRSQCIGNDSDAILSCIAIAPRYPAPSFKATFVKPATDTLQVDLTGSTRSMVDCKGAHVMVALYESGLLTDCTNGANKGKVLANDYVVRRLEKLCSVDDASNRFTGTVSFPLWEGFDPAKCRVAVFIQNSSHHILGSQTFRLPDRYD